MFKNKNRNKSEKSNQFSKGGHTLLDHALEIHGNVRFAGELDVEGTVIGDVAAEEGADALIRVRDRGQVQGEIRAPKMIINGTVTGDIYSTKHLELAANAVVNGNVHYQVIEMVKGAEVNGRLVHHCEVEEPAPLKKATVEAINGDKNKVEGVSSKPVVADAQK